MVELDNLFDQLDQEEETLAQETLAKHKKPKASVSTDQPKEKYAKSTLFVRGVPKDATGEELEEFFSNIGPVRSCFVVTDKNTAVPAPEKNKDGDDVADSDKPEKDDAAAVEKPAAPKNRGFGFVQFVLAEDATRAVQELAEVKFRDERKLMLDFAMKKSAQEQERPQGSSDAVRMRPALNASAKVKDQKRQRIAGKKLESRTIIVSGIAKGTTKHQLIKKVKKSGVPRSVVYPAPFDGATEEQLKDGMGGTAFITYETHGMAQRAAKALNSHIYKGEKISAKIKPEYLDKNARLIVRNLPFKLRENDLEHLFSECGTVLEVKLPRKFTGGPLRGFAFVQMGDYTSAERAVEKWNNHEMYGRKIAVAFAIAKDRFIELEETGEIEKPEFENDSDADVTMKSDNDDDEDDNSDNEDEDVDMENSDDFEDNESNDGKDDDIVDEALQGGCTLFIRNLSFESDEDGMFDLFKSFGKLRYCRIVYDHETGRSRGTAFVCFWNAADAAKCLDEAKKAQELSEKLTNVPSAKLSDQRNKSVLLQEASTGMDSTSQFVLDGRMLSVTKAVDREKAHDLATEGIKARKGKDKRNAYLLKEGVIFPDTPAAAMMAPADLEHHIKEYSVRKNQILKNPNLYISKTRLTVHNIPRSVDEPDLRKAAVAAIGRFKQEVKDKARQPLSKDEMEEGWDKMSRIAQVKIVRSKERVDGSSGKARSMGYGFIEFSTHAHALACLRYLNFRNSKQSFSKKLIGDEEQEGNANNKSAHQISRRSLRVMFAIENAQIIKKRDLRFTLKERKNASREERNRDSSEASAGGNKRKRGGDFQNGKPAKKSRPGQQKSAGFGSSKPFGKGKAGGGGGRTGKGKK
ncbi:RNA recognition motif-containing protein [Coemansia sp. RSA 1813]|nr:RNA recognition motif-containing protein [Coemansia sp. RSA 1646]KAJ1769813.1 RNA recognition motif-containing protein [Coemansia sp. RSA 1843]KAJ2216443.1 RNA recognition motif-containing protein [Coemansia sp. RSA 487]KAJ2571473.1 RNA recognition motif-containing protein [Coemansia sp. RSA 1813]